MPSEALSLLSIRAESLGSVGGSLALSMLYRDAAVKVRTGARRRLEVTSRELIDLCRSDMFAIGVQVFVLCS